MKILLEECLPRKLKFELPGHRVITVQEMGWAGVKNGRLVALAEDEFDALISVDQGLSRQQNLPLGRLVIVVLTAPNNRLSTLQPLMPAVLAELETAGAGVTIRVGSRTARGAGRR